MLIWIEKLDFSINSPPSTPVLTPLSQDLKNTSNCKPWCPAGFLLAVFPLKRHPALHPFHLPPSQLKANEWQLSGSFPYSALFHWSRHNSCLQPEQYSFDHSTREISFLFRAIYPHWPSPVRFPNGSCQYSLPSTRVTWQSHIIKNQNISLVSSS